MQNLTKTSWVVEGTSGVRTHSCARVKTSKVAILAHLFVCEPDSQHGALPYCTYIVPTLCCIHSHCTLYVYIVHCNCIKAVKVCIAHCVSKEYILLGKRWLLCESSCRARPPRRGERSSECEHQLLQGAPRSANASFRSLYETHRARGRLHPSQGHHDNSYTCMSNMRHSTSLTT